MRCASSTSTSHRRAWTAGSPGNTGDTIAAATRLGAKLEFMAEGWWGPTFLVPGEPQARMLIIEKNLPGSIIVNKLGQRFVNESSRTQGDARSFAANKPGAESIPAYMIFDATYRQRYPIGPMLPSTFQPISRCRGRSEGHSERDGRPRARAQAGHRSRRAGRTVSRFNVSRASGKDEDFQRGDANYDRYYGDQSVGPNRAWARSRGAFLWREDLSRGTRHKGGFAVDENARVLREDGSVMRASLPSAIAPRRHRHHLSGLRLDAGPGDVFGYVAANCIAARRRVSRTADVRMNADLGGQGSGPAALTRAVPRRNSRNAPASPGSLRRRTRSARASTGLFTSSSAARSIGVPLTTASASQASMQSRRRPLICAA